MKVIWFEIDYTAFWNKIRIDPFEVGNGRLISTNNRELFRQNDTVVYKIHLPHQEIQLLYLMFLMKKS